MSRAGPPRAEATLTESTRNLVLGAVVTVLLAVSVIAAFVLDGDGDGDGLGVGQETTTTAATTVPPTTTAPTNGDDGDDTTTTVAPPGNGMTTDGTGEMAGPGVIAETGAESLLAPAALLLAAGLALRPRRPRNLRQ